MSTQEQKERPRPVAFGQVRNLPPERWRDVAGAEFPPELQVDFGAHRTDRFMKEIEMTNTEYVPATRHFSLELAELEPIDRDAAIYPIPGEPRERVGMVFIGDRLLREECILEDQIERRFKIVGAPIDGPVRILKSLY